MSSDSLECLDTFKSPTNTITTETNDKMTQQYDVTTYLLDKENIRDTILRMVSSLN
jgi:hypothetical protein